MNNKYIKSVLLAILISIMPSIVFATKGIYLTQTTLENTTYLNYLIKNARAVGIDTFIVDLVRAGKKYERNIKLVKDGNIRYVARIVMFPEGGTAAQIKNPAVWQKRYDLVKQAIAYGANEIQLDYIRYKSSQPASSQNAKDIHEVIKWYKAKLDAQNVPLQIDVFGIASYGEAKYIGQNIKMFAYSVDAVCPMVYPSHYEPASYHSKRPYETVHDSLVRIKKQFANKMPSRLIAYIELSNYRFRMSYDKTLDYIEDQIDAVKDAGADGFYVWSAHNRYDNLFKVLRGE